MTILKDQALILKFIKPYIKGDISKVPDFFDDLKLIVNLKREITKIRKDCRYNVLLTRNIIVSLLNGFEGNTLPLLDYYFKPYQITIIRTFLATLQGNDSLININKDLYKEIVNGVHNRK